jgi:hypothetical protein
VPSAISSRASSEVAKEVMRGFRSWGRAVLMRLPLGRLKSVQRLPTCVGAMPQGALRFRPGPQGGPGASRPPWVALASCFSSSRPSCNAWPTRQPTATCPTASCQRSTSRRLPVALSAPPLSAVSKEVTPRNGVTPLQYLLMLQIKGFLGVSGRRWRNSPSACRPSIMESYRWFPGVSGGVQRKASLCRGAIDVNR